jgi:hypothetical protein
MSFKIATVVLASAVAQNGTFTAQYPADTTAGDFASFGHSLYAVGLQQNFTQDLGGMSVSFGASDITVTYKGATSIPAGTRVTCQFNIAGQDNREQMKQQLDGMKRMVMSPIVQINLGAPDTADDNGIAESQTVTGAGTAFVLNGVYADPYGGAYAVLDVPRALQAAWSNAAVLTITGKDEYGDVIVETTASGTSHTGKKAFKRIDSITTSATVTGATVGTSDVLGLPVFVEKAGQILGELKDGVLLARRSGVVSLQAFQSEAAVDAGAGAYVVSPVAGRITKASSVVATTVTTGGAIAVAVNSTAVDGLSIVVANSAAAGEVDSDTPTAGHASALVAVGDTINFTPEAAFNAAGDMMYTVEIDVDGTTLLDGTFVAGVQTLPTGTTGDVKGTYDPADACDGSLQFALIARLPDPTYKGVDNYDG